MRARIILFCLCVVLILMAAGIFIPQQPHIIQTIDAATLDDIPPVVLPIMTP